MLLSAELRWFWQGTCPPRVERFFHDGAKFLGEPETRRLGLLDRDRLGRHGGSVSRDHHHRNATAPAPRRHDWRRIHYSPLFWVDVLPQVLTAKYYGAINRALSNAKSKEDAIRILNSIKHAVKDGSFP